MGSAATYRERREARASRLREWAAKREVKAASAFGAVERLSGMIPLGQPILVGHHSEGRARRDAARIDGGMRAGLEHARKAEEMAARAETIERQAAGAIYSDDTDAAERLAEKIAALEAERERIKRYNATCRKGQRDLSILDDAQRQSLIVVARVGQIGPAGEFPAYASANLSGNLARLRKRLATMAAEAR